MSILLLSVLAAVVSATGETPSTLTLVEATRVAMQRNADLAEAASRARAAEAGVHCAGSLPSGGALPMLPPYGRAPEP